MVHKQAGRQAGRHPNLTYDYLAHSYYLIADKNQAPHLFEQGIANTPKDGGAQCYNKKVGMIFIKCGFIPQQNRGKITIGIMPSI
ncbi:hypothetical protein [Aeromonas veronii]|uniref:hypothetical protein n=1 Tax=Aeromonas veronii TaxID=654 RepID=UPI00227A792D|nr:hypothetical protein [Aeromonas veronii]